jgi:hypothetical protein
VRNLVVLRAGDGSLHEAWLEGPPRDWDLIVSYWGDDPSRFRRADVTRIDQKGGKFEGLHALFAARPELLKTYDYVWLPDDDLALDCGTINRMFALMAEYGLSIAQPSLAPQGHVIFCELIRNPAFRLRYTTFVETMMPCFDAKYLARIVHLFAGLRFGWHLDGFWARLMPEPEYRAALLDDCEVVHTREPYTGSLYSVGDPNAEGQRVYQAFRPFRGSNHAVYGGVTRKGKLIRRGPLFAWKSLWGANAAVPRLAGRWRPPGGRFRRRVLLRHLYFEADLAPVPIPAAIP